MARLVTAVLIVIVSIAVMAVLIASDHRANNERKALRDKLQRISRKQPSLDAGLMMYEESGGGAFIQLLRRMPWRAALQLLIERAAVKQKPDTFTAIVMLAIALGALTGTILTSSLGGALAIAALGGTLPVLRLSWLASRRQRRFEEQLADALEFMSRALRAGHGLTSSFQMVAEEMKAPIAEEFRQVFDEVNFGLGLQDTLSGLLRRIDSPDLGFFVVGVLIQRETGGNLSELLRNLSKTMRDRMVMKGKVRILASEGKFSGILLGSMPFAMGLLLTIISPDYTRVLWATEGGRSLLLDGFGMLAVGFVWMWKISQIKV